MPRFSILSVFALLGALALLCLTACAPTATAHVVPTVTTLPTPTVAPAPTAPLAPAPTPTNVPAGWAVLDAPHFSLAYPPGWTSQTEPQQDGSVLYTLVPPTSVQNPPVTVLVQERVPSSTVGDPYCMPAGSDIKRTTLANLPMAFMRSGEGLADRLWVFANAQSTVFALTAGDAQSSSVTQAQDDSILVTFRPDDATPWTC